MKKTIVWILAIGVASIIGQTSAAPVVNELSWKQPTERVDGTPLAEGELTGNTVYWSVDNADVRANSLELLPGQGHEINVDLSPRPEPYVLRFAVSATAGSAESGLSNVVSKTVTVSSTAPPNAPTGVTITITCASADCAIEIR